MPRRWRGTVTLENVQTGDGRVFAPGAVEWADLPLPLAWLRDGDQHINLTEVGPQIGTIDALSRAGEGIDGDGAIDDSNPELGGEVVRRMSEGTAPLGNRYPISIDPDNWEVQIVATDAAEEEGILLVASGRGPLTTANVRETVTAALTEALGAAAGDPDPGDGGGENGVVLFEDTVDSILERYTRIRIRGATLCSVAAFDGAWIELVDEAAEPAPAEEEPPATTAAATIPDRPPAEWFALAEPTAGDERLVEQVDGGWAVPLTITDDGQVFGHIARRGQAHRGYASYVPPPTSSTNYREFHTGHVVCDDGTDVATGALVVGCDHAPDTASMLGARDHYANSGLGWADGRMIDGEFGPWFCGALRPGLTEADLRVLRALSLSGDWRPLDGHLELVSVLAVNTPGFPIAREAVAAAVPAIAHAAPAPEAARLAVADGRVVSLVAAGMVQGCPLCAERARAEALAASSNGHDQAWREDVTALLQRLERRTRHLEPVAAAALAERVHRPGD